MDDTKNMIRGVTNTLVYLVVTIVIPYLTFTWIRNLEISGYDITLTQTQYQRILFWIFAFGLVISGCAFFAYSSPPQSIRRGVFSLIQVLLNCFYVWSYKFSGALEIEFELSGLGLVAINLQQMIMVYLGLYFLTIILKIYDIVDFSVNRFKIREERERKKQEKIDKKAEKIAKKAEKKDKKGVKIAKKDDKKVQKEIEKEANTK